MCVVVWAACEDGSVAHTVSERREWCGPGRAGVIQLQKFSRDPELNGYEAYPLRLQSVKHFDRLKMDGEFSDELIFYVNGNKASGTKKFRERVVEGGRGSLYYISIQPQK